MYASNIAANASVLCLDEFQVVDVADAMIIRRLLDQLWQKGVTLVTTSNRAPNDLYKNGLNRSQFVPCIEAIMAKCAVHEMRSGRDYRLMGHKNEDLYEDPRDERLRLGASRGACSSSENQNKSSGTWRVFTVGDKDSKERSNQWLTGKLQRFAKNDRMVTVDVSVQGRRIRVNNASGGVARLTLRGAPRLALVRNFPNHHIPPLRLPIQDVNHFFVHNQGTTPPSRPCSTPWGWNKSPGSQWAGWI